MGAYFVSIIADRNGVSFLLGPGYGYARGAVFNGRQRIFAGVYFEFERLLRCYVNGAARK